MEVSVRSNDFGLSEKKQCIFVEGRYTLLSQIRQQFKKEGLDLPESFVFLSKNGNQITQQQEKELKLDSIVLEENGKPTIFVTSTNSTMDTTVGSTRSSGDTKVESTGSSGVTKAGSTGSFGGTKAGSTGSSWGTMAKSTSFTEGTMAGSTGSYGGSMAGNARTQSKSKENKQSQAPVNTKGLLTICTFDRYTFLVRVEPEDKIIDVKRKIFEEKDIPISEQVLLYNNILLEDQTSVGDVNPEITVNLIRQPKKNTFY